MSLATERRPKAAARLARPAKRYRRGKLPEGVKQPADSDDDDDEPQDEDAEPADVPIGGSGDEEEDEDLPLPQQPAVRVQKKMNLTLRDVDISRDGKVVIAGKHEVGRTGLEAGTSLTEAAVRVDVLIGEESEEESEEEEKPGVAEARVLCWPCAPVLI